MTSSQHVRAQLLSLAREVLALAETLGLSDDEPEPLDALDLLTQRELDVARLVARGLSNRQIADELVIAVGTSERHVANILRKLDFRSRSQLAAWAIVHGQGDEARFREASQPLRTSPRVLRSY